MGHIYLSHPIAIYACPIPWDSHRNDIPMDKPGNRVLLDLFIEAFSLYQTATQKFDII